MSVPCVRRCSAHTLMAHMRPVSTTCTTKKHLRLFWPILFWRMRVPMPILHAMHPTPAFFREHPSPYVSELRDVTRTVTDSGIGGLGRDREAIASASLITEKS